MKSELLYIEDLTVRYITSEGLVTALDSVNLHVGKNELLAVVGESGCGKTTLGLSVIGLLPSGSSAVPTGSINYKGTDLLTLKQKRLREYRGTEIAMIFQEPLTSLNPTRRVGDQIAEAILVKGSRKQGKNSEGEVMQKVSNTHSPLGSHLSRPKHRLNPDLETEIIRWLTLVRIADPEQILERYPFELSGGMTQRVMIAMALSQEPALLIADEPTTALDVTTQAQVLKLMRELMDRLDTSVLLVTHDLAVASQVADRILVMYAGEVVEDAEVHALFSEPFHPYTKGLLACVPSGTKHNSSLRPIQGSIPDLRETYPGCKFTPRCPYVFERCSSNHPSLFQVKDNHDARCFLYDR
jgi:oligopeptide/dipeptide ABC transporter ATP-binding protein